MGSYYLEQLLSSFMVQLSIKTFSKKEIKNLTKESLQIHQKEHIMVDGNISMDLELIYTRPCSSP